MKMRHILRTALFVLVISGFMVQSCGKEPVEKKRVMGVVHPEWSRNKTIYELNVRQFSPSGTFKAVEQRLVALKDLGVGIIWLMPIHPIGQKNRKGTLGSPYSVQDYFAVNPEYGSLQDFKSLVEKVHRLGMYVILDWVANHTAWDNPLLKQHPEWFKKDSAGNFVSPAPDWTDVVDLDYSQRGLWQYMIKAMKYWVEVMDVDGFRCDVAEMVPLAFWEKARAELDKIKPVFMLAEGEKPELHRAFDMTYSWKMHYLWNAIADGDRSAKEIDDLLREEKKIYPADAYRMRFISNHDENAWKGTAFERLDGGVRAFSVLMTTIPGKPLLYNGQEVGLDKRLKFFDKDPIEWKINNYRRFYRRLFTLYQAEPALYEGNMTKIPTEMDSRVYAFAREKGNRRVVVILNLSPVRVKVDIDSDYLDGSMVEYFTGIKVNYRGHHTFDLEPWAYRLYLPKND